MRTKLITTIATLTAIAATAAEPGTFTAVATWSAYSDTNAAGFKIYLATGTAPYSDPATKVFSVTNRLATNFTFSVQPATSYRLAITAFGPWQESPKSDEFLFSTPTLLSAPTNARVALIVYVP